MKKPVKKPAAKATSKKPAAKKDKKSSAKKWSLILVKSETKRLL